jgi:fibronectin type 3 domain-containing protein
MAFLIAVGVVILGVAAKYNFSSDSFRQHPSEASSAHSVRLRWTASPSPTTIGYRVYRSDSSGSGYVMLNSKPVPGLSYVDTSVSNGHTYYYVITAVDGKGNESSYSKEIQMKVP